MERGTQVDNLGTQPFVRLAKLADVLEKRNQVKEAADLYNRAISLGDKPETAFPLYRLGLIELRKDPATARDLLQRAINVDPTGKYAGPAMTWLAFLKEDAPGLGTSGERLPSTPGFAASLGAMALFDLGGHAGHVGLSERYVGERNAGFDGSTTAPNYRMPAYWLTDLQGGIDFGRLALGLYVRNVFDRRAELGTSTSEMALGGPAQVVPTRPRTVGMTLTASF